MTLSKSANQEKRFYLLKSALLKLQNSPSPFFVNYSLYLKHPNLLISGYIPENLR